MYIILLNASARTFVRKFLIFKHKAYTMRPAFRARAYFAHQEGGGMNKILTANLSGTFPATLKRDVYTRRTATRHRRAIPECCYLQSFRIYVYIRIYIYIYARGPSAGDGRTSAHITRALPVRIHKVHTPDKIPELHFVWNCNFAGFTYGRSATPSRPPVPPAPSLPLPFCIGGRAACIISTWMRRGGGGEPAGWAGDICGVFSLGKQQAAA